ncbi:Glioma tumor suppressor candidate region domain containing protein [Russula decolorans]
MSTPSLLSLPHSPSPSTPDPVQSHDPSPPSPTPAPTPIALSLPSTSASGQIDIIPPVLPSPSRLLRRRPSVVPLTPDEEAAAARVSARVASRLTTDHISALFPDVDSPFRGIEDVVDRLLPYHVFQHPREDLLKVGKGKQKATETDILRSELQETKFALECFKRRRELEERFRRARTKSGKRTASDDQAYYLERQVLDCERAEHSALTTELRNAKSELERVTRLQRAAALPQRANYYSSAPPVYAHHYRTYHYPYAQTYGAPAGSTAPQGYPYSVPLSSTISQYVPPALATATSTIKTQSAATASTAGPASAITPSPLTPASDTSIPVPTSSASGTSSAIPVQLPVSSLPTLHALGIVPVPPQSLSANSPTPPAVLRGTSANGAMLNLEINVSLLQAAQMSGLALVLNSIMRSSSTTGSGEVPVGAPYIYPYTTAQLSATATAATSSTNAEPNKTTTQPQEQEKT